MKELADFNSTAENYNASPQSEGQPDNLLESFESLGSSPGEASGTATRSSSESQVLTLQEVGEKPWKYIGYQGYSKVLSSDTDFLVFRRFGAINARNLLRLQDRVVILEEALEDLDRKLKRQETPNIHNGWFRQDYEGREMILDKIQKALSEYNAFLLQQGELSRQYPTAPPHAIKSLLNWHKSHGSCAIAEEETNYLSLKHDLISLAPKSTTPLRRLLESSRWFRLHLIWKDKDVPELPLYEINTVRLYSERKIDRFIAVVITALGTLMLVVPLWVLPNLEDMNAKLGTITAFVVVFLGLVAYTTTAKLFESLAAAAAYTAVLTVFLQLGAINSP